MSDKPGYLIVMPWEVTDQGGVNGVVRHLIREMNADGKYKPILLESDWNRTDSYCKPWDGTPTFRMRFRAPIGRKGRCRICSLAAYLVSLPASLYRIRKIVKKFRVRVINVHYPSVNAVVFTILRKLRLFDGKLILTFHNSDATENLKLRGTSRRLYRMVLRDADVIVSVSKQLIGAIVNDAPEAASKVKVIYNGVELQRFPAKGSVGTRQPKGDGRTIICVAAFELRKGIDVLLHAFAGVRSVHADVRLLIVGESGGDDETLMDLARRLGVAPYVEWRCGVSADEVARLLMQADLFVLPSRDEGFPLALLEAGAAALPVVATRVGGVPELIVDGENGLLVDSEDAGALKTALLRAFDDPSMLGAGARLRKIVAESFTWEAMYRRYERVAE